MASILQIKGRWRAQVRRKGHPAYTETFGTKAEAERWARAVESQIDSGRRPQGRVVIGHAYLLRDVIRDYRRLRANSRPVDDESNEHYQLKRLARHMGERDALSLTTDDLVEFCRERAEDGAGPYTINMDIGKLGTVLRLVFGVKRLVVPDVVAQARPALTHLGLIGGGGRRERRPNDDELSGLLAWLARERAPIYADVVRFAVVTAMRRAEVCRIVWEDVDTEKKMVMIRQRKHPRQKKANDEWVPLLHGAWELVQAQPTRVGRIFPVHPRTISKYFRDACLALSIPDLQLRDMRHEGVSRLFEYGYQIQEVALVSGHRKWETLRRYTQLKPEDLHQGPAADAGDAPAPAARPGARPRRGSRQSAASLPGTSGSGKSPR